MNNITYDIVSDDSLLTLPRSDGGTIPGATVRSEINAAAAKWSNVSCCNGHAAKLALVLTNDRPTGVMRHADAGYEIAINLARATWMILPIVGE